MSPNDPLRLAMDKLRASAGAPPMPAPVEVESKHEVVKHTFVTRTPYLWFGIVVGLVVGGVVGYFLR